VLSRTALHFVRCVKPNAAQVPSTFDASLVLHQLRCCGVLEVTRIARAGYPTRYLHQEFADRYGILLTPKARGKPIHTTSTHLLPQIHGLTSMSDGGCISCQKIFLCLLG